jgi:hypothetical protein
MDMFQFSNNDILYCSELHEAFTENQCSRQSGSPIHTSTDEQISRHFGKASIQDERVCVLKVELVDTTSLLKKEEMIPRLGGSTKNIIEDIH